MDKKTFNMIQEYAVEVNKLYFELEKIVGMEKAEELISSIDNLEYKNLGFDPDEDMAKYLDADKLMQLTEDYNGIPKHLYVIRECKDDMLLCSTVDEFHLVPRHLLAEVKNA